MKDLPRKPGDTLAPGETEPKEASEQPASEASSQGSDRQPEQVEKREPRESAAGAGVAPKRRGNIAVPLRVCVAASDLAGSLDAIIEALDSQLARTLAKSRAFQDDRYPGATPVPTEPRFTWYGPELASVPVTVRHAVEQRIAEVITRRAATDLRSAPTGSAGRGLEPTGEVHERHGESKVDTTTAGSQGDRDPPASSLPDSAAHVKALPGTGESLDSPTGEPGTEAAAGKTETAAPAAILEPEQVQAALRFYRKNATFWPGPKVAQVSGRLGIAPREAVDEAFVQAAAAFQQERALTVDGMLGAQSLMPLFEGEDMDRAHTVANRITAVYESAGNYGVVQNVDAGIISFGAHQTTLASGNLGHMLQQYIYEATAAGEVTDATRTIQGYMPRIQDRAQWESLRNEAALLDALRASGAEQIMRDTQDAFFSEDFWVPAVRAGLQHGITSRLGFAALYDAKIQGGMEASLERARASLGGIVGATVERDGEIHQITEAEFLIAFNQARENRLERIAERREGEGRIRDAEMLRNSQVRPRAFEELARDGNLDLSANVDGEDRLVFGTYHGGRARIEVPPAVSTSPAVPGTAQRRLARRIVGAAHKVGDGETLLGIARKYEVGTVDLMRWNRDSLGALQPGWTLALPANPQNASAHTVAVGESLWSIARIYVGAEDVHRVNAFVDATLAENRELLARNNLKAGMTVRIVQSGTSSASGGEGTVPEEQPIPTSPPAEPTEPDRARPSALDLPRRDVDAGVSCSIPLAKRTIKTAGGLAYEISGSLEVKLTTARDASIKVDWSSIEAKLTHDLKIGVNNKGEPSIAGEISGQLGSLEVAHKGSKMIFEYEPFKLPLGQGNGQLEFSVALKIEVGLQVNAARMAIRATKKTLYERTVKHLTRIVAKRFGAAVAARTTALLGLIAVDGPLPIGDAVALGLTIWTVCELLLEIGEMWAQAEELAAEETAREGH